MRIEQYIALLDACVLVPMPVADTLLRLAEEPAFYTPRWSVDILQEVEKTLQNRFHYTSEQINRRITVMRTAFPDATIDGYHDLIGAMKNHKDDRHVLAAAIKGGVHAVVSDNKKHFPKDILEPYGLECLSANEFIEHQYHLNPDAFIVILKQQADNIGWALPKLISHHVPCLSRLIITPRSE